MNKLLLTVGVGVLVTASVLSGIYAVSTVVRPSTVGPTPTPTPEQSRFTFECKVSVVNPCKKHGRVVAYGTTCEEARVLLENDLQTMACK